MSDPILQAEDVTVSFGGLRAVDGATLRVRPGAVHALIGPNGAGKTTLFNVISGLAPAAAGHIAFEGRAIAGLPSWRRTELGLARTFQNLRLFAGMSALENVMSGMHARLHESTFAILARSRRFRAAEREGRDRAMELLTFVGLGGKGSRLAGELAYGDQRRLEIARALASQPRLLMLDEPAAGMNPTEKKELARLARSICGRGVTILLVEHDMRFVMELSEWITVLNFGRVIADGAPESIRNDPRVIEAYLGSHASDGPRPATGASA